MEQKLIINSISSNAKTIFPEIVYKIVFLPKYEKFPNIVFDNVNKSEAKYFLDNVNREFDKKDVLERIKNHSGFVSNCV